MRSLRIRVNEQEYIELRRRCQDHGDISRVVRFLLREWFNGKIDGAPVLASRLEGGEWESGQKDQAL